MDCLYAKCIPCISDWCGRRGGRSPQAPRSRQLSPAPTPLHNTACWLSWRSLAESTGWHYGTPHDVTRAAAPPPSRRHTLTRPLAMHHHSVAKDPRFKRLKCMHKGTYADDCIVNRISQVRGPAHPWHAAAVLCFTHTHTHLGPPRLHSLCHFPSTSATLSRRAIATSSAASERCPACPSCTSAAAGTRLSACQTPLAVCWGGSGGWSAF